LILASVSLAALAGIALGFGMPAADRAKIDAFADAAPRWQVNPDFRQVQSEYVRLGSDAMQARWWGAPVGCAIIAFRSIPGLSATYAVNAGSASHYEDFTRGPLSAYLHLTNEQGLDMGLNMIERLGHGGVPSDDDLREFLRSFNMPTSVATDRGAIQSVRSLLSQTDPSKAFMKRAPLGPELATHIAAIAQRAGYPADPARMTSHEQAAVLAELDEQIRSSDFELWRTKQVSDFLSGIWAQGYGQIYARGVTWFYRLRWGARVTLLLMLLGIAECIRRLPARAAARPRAAGGA